jgi:hypothetical protein
VVLALYTALAAVSHAVRVAFFLQILKAGFIVGETIEKVLYGESQVLWNALLGFHGKDSLPYVLLDVKG